MLWLRTSDGHVRQLMLKPMTVAEFYEDVMIALKELRLTTKISTMPSEIADCIAFAVTRPSHVNVDLMLVKPIAQAAPHKIARRPS